MAFDPIKLGGRPVQTPQATGGFNPAALGGKQITGPQWTPPAPPPPPKPVTFGSIVSGGARAAGSAVGNVALGAGKTVARQLLGLGGGIQNVLGSIVGAPKAGAGAQKIASSQALQPSGLAQNVGDIGATVGEYFLPGGAEAKGAEAIGGALKTAPELLGLTGKAAKAAQLGTKALASGIATGVSTGAVSALQGQNAAQGAKWGFLGGAAGKALESVGGALAKSLQKADFKLSPMQATKAAKKAENAAQFMTDNKIAGSATTKYRKLTNVTQNLENTLRSSLPKTIAVPKSEIISKINANVEKLRTEDPAAYASARSQANQAINVIKSTKDAGTISGSVSVENTLLGKRSFGKKAFKSAKIYDPQNVPEGAYAVEQAYQSALENAMASAKADIKIPKNLQSYFGGKESVSLPEFNKVYSHAISAQNLTFMAQEKKDAGLVGRLFSLWVGEQLGQTVAPGLGGKLVGGAIGEMSAERIPGAFRNVAERTAMSTPAMVPAAVKLGLGASAAVNPSSQSQ